ncbi:MAG TPA: pyruvate kinase [Ignavibacteriaceae bacterium]|nr:pyruvate kinase [Ignavibacteriaceae bacterium]
MKNEIMENFAKTKILCTLGPATNTSEMIKQLIISGMDGIRLNFSHGDFDFYKNIFDEIHNACVDEHTPISILIDLQGPKIRIGNLSDPEIEIVKGEEIEITTNDVIGTKKLISTSYKSLVDDAKVGNSVLIDDGLLRLKIIKKKKSSVICLIENGGTLRPKKGMNLPGMTLSTPSVTEKDLKNLEFALKHRVDFVALSFVRSAGDITFLKNWLKERGSEVPVIAKIEKKEACDSIDEILEVADGIMVARGDLGVELPPQDVPILQKEFIKKCNANGKLVITATQMLDSMIHNPIPTRAEASDVANAVLDGTDVVMLSGETSVGKFPLKTVQIMNDIIRSTDPHFIPREENEFETPKTTERILFDSVGRAIVAMSRQINAAAIVVFTFQGRTAINLSKYRPKARIIAISNSFDTMNKLCLRWGVTSMYCADIDKEHFAIDIIKKMILEDGQVKEGDIVIFAAGAPYSEKSRANWLRFEVI